MLQLSNIYIQYGDRILLNRVSMTVKDTDRLGLVGRNGAGKSTIMKVMIDDIRPDEGQVDMPTAHTIGLLRQDIEIPTHRTIIDETLTAMNDIIEMGKRLEQINVEIGERTDYESDAYADLIQELSDLSEQLHLEGGMTIEGQASRVLQGLGFDANQLHHKVSTLSGGWKMRIELAKLLLRKPTYLLLDEPTNHLDIEAILWLESWLDTYPGAIVVISHDKTFLDRVTKKTIEVELGQLNEYAGNYSKYLIDRVERQEIRKSEYENQQKLIAHKEQLIEKFRAKANKAKMAQSLIKELDRMPKLELIVTDNSKLKIKFPPCPRSGTVVFKADRLTKKYGDKTVLENIDLQIDRGDKIAFVGQNGQGKTTLARIIADDLKASAGELNHGHNVALGYYAQDQAEQLVKGTTVLQTMELASPPEMRTQLRSILGAFMFSGEDADKQVQVLSGGERARLAMAKLLLQPMNLLILDEPTNHLDMATKDVLKSALLKFEGTMIVVSHDRDFLDGLSDRTIEFRDKQLFNYIGDVQAFLDKREARNMREVELSTPQAKKKSDPKPIAAPISKDVQKKIKSLENKIMKLEHEIEAMQKTMGADGFYERDDADSYLKKYADKQADLEAVMEEWEVLV